MLINKDYPCHSTNYRKTRRDKIKYIVIHYVGATGGAENNVKYYGSTANVGASAHYYVGHASEEGRVYQSVPDNACAWHCGSETGKYYHECRNDSAIGIEMCCHRSNGSWYFDDITVEKTIELTRELMAKYNIPAENVIRHYDVTHKTCPAPFVKDAAAWNNFKNRVLAKDGGLTMAQYEELKKEISVLKETIETIRKSTEKVYNYLIDVPEWGRPTIQKLLDKGLYKGASASDLNLPESLLRTLVINDRAGLYN